LGNCVYCGKAVGLFRSKHPECETEHQNREAATKSTRQKIIEQITNAITSKAKLDNLENEINRDELASRVFAAERNKLLVSGWENSVEKFLDDGVLDEQEEKSLMAFKEYFSLSQSGWPYKTAHGYTRLVANKPPKRRRGCLGIS
jgi:hypothetical protein